MNFLERKYIMIAYHIDRAETLSINTTLSLLKLNCDTLNSSFKLYGFDEVSMFGMRVYKASIITSLY